MQSVSSQVDSDALLATLVGDDCAWCASGALTRGSFKDDDAVVCENCGTPAARVW